jgi:hypothetical protein
VTPATMMTPMANEPRSEAKIRKSWKSLVTQTGIRTSAAQDRPRQSD